MYILNGTKKINRTRLEIPCQPIDSMSHAQLISNKMLMHVLKSNYLSAVGLGANQVGILRQLFIAKINNKWSTYINPQITHYSDDLISLPESCLSFPNKTIKISRYATITLSYTDLSGNQRTKDFKDFDARIIQHEIDHLNGIHILNKENK